MMDDDVLREAMAVAMTTFYVSGNDCGASIDAAVKATFPILTAAKDREIAAKDATIKTLYDDRDGEREFIASLRAENARLQRIADAQPGFDNVIIAQLRAENAALKANLAERPTNAGERERVIAAMLPKVGSIFHGQTGANVAGELADAAIAAMDRPTISADVVEAVEQARDNFYEHSGLYKGLTQATAALRATHTITGGKDG